MRAPYPNWAKQIPPLWANIVSGHLSVTFPLHYQLHSAAICGQIVNLSTKHLWQSAPQAYRKHSTGGKNLTNSIYNDFNSYLIDYRLNEKIEKYIYKILNKKIIFSTFRWKLFFKSTIKTVLKFSDYSLKVYFLLFNLHIRWVIDKFNEEGL